MKYPKTPKDRSSAESESKNKVHERCFIFCIDDISDIKSSVEGGSEDEVEEIKTTKILEKPVKVSEKLTKVREQSIKVLEKPTKMTEKPKKSVSISPKNNSSQTPKPTSSPVEPPHRHTSSSFNPAPYPIPPPKNPKNESKSPKSNSLTQNLLSTISQYESLTATLPKTDPTRTAYLEVINSLKKQLNASFTIDKKPQKTVKQIEPDSMDLSASEILRK